ncbi:Single-stranded-DNA-specific exonuclease RecJ [archaeon HR01]|nr:Single-stranded-DNA-specific exonuclease RecJ [archaeon HR01]
MEEKVRGFLRDVEEAAERIRDWIREGSQITIFTHNDADALSSCGILAGALRREEARFRCRSLHRIEEFYSLASEGYLNSDRLVFTDMGGGYVGELAERLKNFEVVILDHHEPSRTPLPEGWVHVNPHLHGIDGATEVSASGVVYFTAKALNPANTDYAAVAVVGALGDLQDKNSVRRLHGLNELIVRDGVENGLLETYDDFVLYGRTFRPLHVALASTTSPFIPGLSGREDACYNFITSLGINVKEGDQWRTLSDLSEEEKKKLFSGLVEYLVARKMPAEMANELIGTAYDLKGEEGWIYLRDGREYATLLNSCGKTGRPYLGIAVAMGERGEILEEASQVLEEYRASLAKTMEYVSRPGVLETLNHTVVLKGGGVIDERQVSSVATILSSSGMIPRDRPLIALAEAGEYVKISARASRELVSRGLNLGSILSRLSVQHGGRGGGHNIAAGAEIPSDRLLRFLADFDRCVGEVLSDGGGVDNS